MFKQFINILNYGDFIAARLQSIRVKLKHSGAGLMKEEIGSTKTSRSWITLHIMWSFMLMDSSLKGR